MSDPPREEPSPQRPVVGDLAAGKAVVAREVNVGRDLNLGAAPSRPRPTLKPPRYLPERNKRFVGRKRQLREIHRLLQQKGELGITQEVAVHAHGGIGKTALAVEYAWEHLAGYPGGLFFVSCDTALLLPAVAALAGPLGLDEGETPEQTAAWVKTWLESGESGGPSLLILDNVRDGGQWKDAQWRKWLPGGQNCRRLITTRDDHLPPARYQLERLPQGDGIKLLAKYRKVARSEKQMAGRLVEWFDGLAVGLTVVGAYMADHPDLGWADYVAALEAKGLGAVRATEDEVGPLPDYDLRVDAVFDDLLEALPPEHRRALQYGALLPEDCVLPGWLAWLLENDGQIELPELPGYAGEPSRPVIDRLKERDLLRVFRGDDARLSLHRVLRRRLVELLDEAPQHRDTLLENLCALAEFRGEASHDAVTQSALRDELTPLLRLSDALLRLGRTGEAARLANWIHTPLRGLARTAEGRDSLERFIDAPLAPDGKATTLSNLALILEDQGDLPGAREQMERAIAIRQQHFPEDHPTLATSYSNLAMILQAQGDFPGARQQMERAIAIDEKHFPEDHPALATSYSNLALILKDQGDFPGARQQMERAIALKQQHFPEDHPTLATSYSNLAAILKDQGDLPGARQQIERAIALKQQHFPEDHPTLATSYSNLATILQDQGDLPGAREQMERAIAIWQQHFPEDHPTLATSYNNLGHIELAEGHVAEARELIRRAHAIRTKHFTAEHPDVQAVARMLKMLGDLPEEE